MFKDGIYADFGSLKLMLKMTLEKPTGSFSSLSSV
jgi:hypothetical protein